MKDKVSLSKARQYLVGGVDSPVRSFEYAGCKPLIVKRAKGSKLYDYQSKSYLDYNLSFGAMLLGHAHNKVVKAVKQILAKGSHFGTTTSQEVELAGLIVEALPSVDKVRFVNSGTEAVMGAVRLARGYTNRDKIIKFTNSYHGHADYLLAKSGSGLATLSIAKSAGIPKSFIKDTLIVDYQDVYAVESLFKKHPGQIAAVLVEPIAGNYGVGALDNKFLSFLRGITKKNKTLLIFDEIITGFRFNYGSLAKKIKIKPDLICLGKIIGGGLPIGAYAGKARIMNKLAPLGKVYQASTFAGNPVVMSSGLETLKILALLEKEYKALNKKGEELAYFIDKEALCHGLSLKVSYYGSMFSLKFKSRKIFRKFYASLLKSGIYFSPSEYEANFLSFAHRQEDLEKTKKVIKKIFKEI